MKRLLLALALTLTLAPSAQAARWPDKPPLPPRVPALQIVQTAGATYYDETRNIIVTDGPLPYSHRLHEYGHAFDRQVMSDAERAAFTAMIGMTGRKWDNGYDARGRVVPGVEEFFADEYMTCRLGLLPQLYRVGNHWASEWITSYGYTPRTNQLQRRIARAMVVWAAYGSGTVR